MKRIIRLAILLLLLFSLAASPLTQAQAVAIRLRYSKATMKAGQTATLKMKVTPATSVVSWKSSDTAVAVVSQTGRITAKKAGSAVITASCGSAAASCRLTVKPVKITSVSLSSSRQTVLLSQGSVQLTAKVKPAAADASTLKWKSSASDVATVNSTGLVTLKGAGTVKISASSPSGKKAVCTLKVKADPSTVTRRGLVIGEGRASSTYHLPALPMTAGEVRQIAGMFRDRGIRTTALTDSTYAKVVDALQSTFSGADENDVSYVYIACHGGAQGTGYYLYLSGNGRMTAARLRSLLDKIPGQIVLILDCCESGALISKSAADSSLSFLSAFNPSGVIASKKGEFIGSKYKVLCACTSSQSGWGVVTTNAHNELVEDSTYNFFAKAVLEAGEGKADVNADGRVTLQEIFTYARSRVVALYSQWQAKIGLDPSDTQTVVVYPANSNFVLF